MRNEIFQHYNKLSYSFFDQHKIGHIMTSIMKDLNNISEALHHIPEEIIITGGKILGSIMIVINLSCKLAIIFTFLLSCIVLYLIYFIPKINQMIVKDYDCFANINAQAENSLLGIKTVKSFVNEKVEILKFKRLNSYFVSSQKNTFKAMGRVYSLIMPFITGIPSIIAIIGVLCILNKDISMNELFIFLLYEAIVIESIFNMFSLLDQSQGSIAGFKRFMKALYTKSENIEAKETINLVHIDGNIKFNNVYFHYKNSEDILKNANLEIKAGEHVALVGQSGAGKTTICNLIPRFYEVCKGQITLDGVDIRKIKIEDLRKNVGYVSQDTYLFDGTILENIRYGNLIANDKAVIEAAKYAYAHDFIMGLKDGYYTKIGSGGIQLSGGQKQRLSIARVFLKKAPIFIFDESTSNIDKQSAQYIQDSIKVLSKDKTTIIITHKFSTIKNVDKIFFIKDGKVTSVENFEELMDYSESYF